MKKNRAKTFQFQYILGIGIILLNLQLVATTENSNGDDEDHSPYSAKEMAALDKFRPLVNSYLTEFFMSTDAYLFRWLKSCDMDVSKAVTKLKQLAAWREKNKMETILDEDLSAHDRAFPHKIDGVTKEGLPIVQLIIGQWEFRKYVMAGKHKLIQRYWFQLMERAELKAHVKAKLTGAKMSQVYFLDDFDGYSYEDQQCIPCTPVLLDIIRSVAANHPKFIQKNLLVNVPESFKSTLKLAKAVMPKDMARVTIAYGHNKKIWKPVVLADIDEDQIPPNFGGTKVDEDEDGSTYEKPRTRKKSSIQGKSLDGLSNLG